MKNKVYICHGENMIYENEILGNVIMSLFNSNN